MTRIINPYFHNEVAGKRRWEKAVYHGKRMSKGINKNSIEAISNLKRFLAQGKISQSEFDVKIKSYEANQRKIKRTTK